MLRRHGVRETANRLIVLKALASEKMPVSLTELESSIDSIDKSGIFRTLSIFREHHLVHVLEDGDGVRYELCLGGDGEEDDDVHVHFHCEKCHRTSCLDGIPVPGVKIPDGYERRSANYLIKGICPECAGKS